MEERRFLDHGMTEVAPAFIPAFRQVRELELVVLKSLQLLFVRKGSIGRATRSEQESLHADQHAATLQRLSFSRLVEHSLQSLQVSVLKDFLNALVNLFLELVTFHFLELRDLFVNFVEVNISELLISHDLLGTLSLNLIASLLG